jgi:hypothetical protein
MTPHTITNERGFGFKATTDLVRQYASVKGTVFACVSPCGMADYTLTVRHGRVLERDGQPSVFVLAECGGRVWEPLEGLYELVVGVYPPEEWVAYQDWCERNVRNADPT